MPEYKLIVNEDGAIILDQSGEAVDSEAALALLDMLNQGYERPACVYVMHSKAMNAYKIGWTSQKIENRVSQVQYDTKDWRGIDVELTIPCTSISEARALESQLHIEFADQNVYGEWFDLPADSLMQIWNRIPDNKTRIRVLLNWVGKFRAADPSKARPQDLEHVRFVYEEMWRELEDFDRKWGF